MEDLVARVRIIPEGGTVKNDEAGLCNNQDVNSQPMKMKNSTQN